MVKKAEVKGCEYNVRHCVESVFRTKRPICVVLVMQCVNGLGPHRLICLCSSAGPTATGLGEFHSILPYISEDNERPG